MLATVITHMLVTADIKNNTNVDYFTNKNNPYVEVVSKTGNV